MDQNLMKTRRLELDKFFQDLCPHVYFQPPESLKMQYPAIRYRRTTIEPQAADNLPYVIDVGYEVTVIDKDPDSAIVFELSKLPRCRMVRHYTADNLNHDTFIIYP